MLNRFLRWFERRADWGAIFIRLAVGSRLVEGTQDNVFDYTRMLEFEQFLALRGVPFPLFSAVLSVYAQFICGILVTIGLFTRPAGLVIAINFVFALLIAHRDTPFLATWQALMMLAGGLFLLFNGPGAFSLDRVRSRTRSKPEPLLPAHPSRTIDDQSIRD
jgi:putative oxidoreductase